MYFRIIAFLVGLIAVIAGMQNYDRTVSSSPIPLITGGLVMLIAIFNLIPQFKRCAFCGKKLPRKKQTCPFCKKDQHIETS
jgi:hypothetical protein